MFVFVFAASCFWASLLSFGLYIEDLHLSDFAVEDFFLFGFSFLMSEEWMSQNSYSKSCPYFDGLLEREQTTVADLLIPDMYTTAQHTTTLQTDWFSFPATPITADNSCTSWTVVIASPLHRSQAHLDDH